MRLLIISILLFWAGILSGQNYVPEKNNPKFKVQPTGSVQAFAFNLADLRLKPGSPFYNAMEKDAAYLLKISPDRLLYRFYKNASLPVKDSVYGGWESEGLSGHTLGHYLSACAMMYSSTGNAEFRSRVEYIVRELGRCQQARKTGYIGAIPNEDSIFGRVARGEIKTGGFDLNGGWSPWYTFHKVLCGLIDAYLYCDNKQALDEAAGMADWTFNTINHLTDEQRNKMLQCEWGGMNDALANLYAITGNDKYLKLSYKFYDQFVMEPLANRIDPMPGKHSNTQVPKAIGSARQYELTSNTRDLTIASFFWSTMVNHHTYANGGNSNYEYCGEPDKLNDRLSDNTSETCNTYNMLKLTRHLFGYDPQAKLNDYYERALYNHILASQNPETGMMCYFVPMRMGAKKQFSDEFHTFTCCVGTGMENHSKYTENIYSEGADGSLYVNLFIGSVLDWKSRGIRIDQSTSFPEQSSTTITISAKKAVTFPVRLRQPGWSQPISVEVNGVRIKTETENGYVVVNRKWKDSDKINVVFTMSLRTEAMPDNADRIAIMYGPLLMAGELGSTEPEPIYGAPVLLTGSRAAGDWVSPAGGPLAFRLDGVGKPNDVTLAPFYKVYNGYYNVYWDLFDKDSWAKRQQSYEDEKRRAAALEKRTIDLVRLGEMQPERDHKLKHSEQSYADVTLGRGGREVRKGGFFSFEMKVVPDEENVLQLSYLGDDKGRFFDILVDGTVIATQELKGGRSGHFTDIEYPVPVALTKGRTAVTVTIQAKPEKTAGRVFTPRMLRKG